MSTLPPSHSSPNRLDLPSHEQCLRNSDLLQEILHHIPSEADRSHLKAQRQSLLWIALTCKDFSPSGIKFLWRTLDNLLPLLCLLPSFTLRDGMYRFVRAVQHREWESFDRHAALIKEIRYFANPSDQMAPSVYVILALHSPRILPNVERFVCRDLFRALQIPVSEMLLYAQAPLQYIEIRDSPGTMGSTFMFSLPANPPHISCLILVGQPLSTLDDVTPLEHLVSLEVRCMSRIGIEIALLKTFLHRIGSLPRLRSFTADSTCFHAATDTAPPLVEPPVEPAGFFKLLTHLHFEGNIADTNGAIPAFLRNIATKEVRSLTLRHTGDRRALQPGTRGLVRGGCSRAGGSVVHTESRGDILYTIAEWWSATLWQLDLELDDGRSFKSVYNFLALLSALRNLNVLGSVEPFPNLESAELKFVCAKLPHLETLSVQSHDSSGTYIPWAMRCITELVGISTKLRELAIPLGFAELPPLSSARPAKNLKHLTVYASKPITDPIALARYLDCLFPCLNSLRYESSSGGGIELEAAWAQVRELMFAFQDVWRRALASV
ncbi:hypothetical protein B0H16DRAFT_1693274 [Mycena metata]|uniref:Uncharacterized protein n=1 Tax=Mycena metata TaxID=1033252 RepID=A0AAD7IKW8_9AGAR|nr:hypothetical protein B0H16DRAFT_1693274 [Mycena metata]